MRTQIKKLIAISILAVMILSSFSVFAENADISVFMDKYIDIDATTKVEVLDETDLDTVDENISDNPFIPEKTTEAEQTFTPELSDDFQLPDMTIWDDDTPLDWNEEFVSPVELNADDIASGKCGDNLTWTLNSEGTLTISGTGDMYDYHYVNDMPWAGYKDDLKKLIMNSGITHIGSNAFYNCSNFTGDIVIPDTVVTIGKMAFLNCSNFDGHLIISDSVTNIDSMAFLNCSGLTGNLIIPDSVTSIGSSAFGSCSGLTGNLVIPNNITNIESDVFRNCSGLTGNLVIPDGVTQIGNRSFEGCNGLIGDIIIPDSVISIGFCAFSLCGGFTGNLVIPDSVTSIGYSAFFGCSGLTGNLIIPDKITSIENNTFYQCSKLTGNLIIPDGVTQIGNSAFEGCVGLEGNLIIPDGVTDIGVMAFGSCSGLTGNLIIPDSIMIIAPSAFSGCNSLTDIYIPKTENSISTGAFPNRIHWKYDLSKCTATITDYTCTGEAIVPTEDNITVTSPNGKTLYYGTDYIIESAKNNTNVGTATARITPPMGGISILSQDVPFNIISIDLSGATVTFPNDILYQGEACMPEPTVVVNGKTLAKDTDYTVSYSNNNAVGTATAIITGKGNYTGSKTVHFEIEPFAPDRRNPVSINNDTVETSVNGTFIYDGSAKEPKPILIYHFINETTGTAIDYTMIEGTDYNIISYANNINAGTARIVIGGNGAFEGQKILYFSISQCEVSETEIADIPSVEYCKEDICPEPEIRIGDKILEKDVDYTLEYENNRNRGTASVIITGKGNISGTITKNFEITPRDGSRFTIIVWL